MSKELELDDLQAETATVETKATKVKKEVSAEDVAALEAACQKIQEFGVSDNFAQAMKMVPMWHDKDANAAVKQEVVDAFGGSDKFKDYVDGEFQEELAVIAGLNKVASTLNNIKSFYARRASKGRTKVKYSSINIGGEFYNVNAEYYASLAGTSNTKKKELLLAHADTKKNESIEVL